VELIINFLDTLAFGSRLFRKSGPPIQLTFFLTARCNLRCKHCFYWKEIEGDHSHELSIEEISKIAKSLPRLLVLSLTGGEPFIRRDIDEVMSVFCEKTRPLILTISSNGYYIKNMEKSLSSVLTKFPDTTFIIYLSIDGPEKIHDQIRGDGSHKKAIEALYALQKFRTKYKNLNVSISMTCNRVNESYLTDTFNQLEKSNLADNVNIGFVRGDPKDPMTRSVGLKYYKKLTNLKVKSIENRRFTYFKFLLSRLVSMKDYYTYKIVESVIKNDKHVTDCYAGSLFGVLYDDGKISPCEILEDTDFGNVRDFNYNLPLMWKSPKGNEIRNKIIKGKCFCTFECAMSTSIMFNPKYLLKSTLRSLRIIR